MDLNAVQSWKWLQDPPVTPQTTTVPTNDVTDPTKDIATESAPETTETDNTQTTVKPDLKIEKVADATQSTSNQADDELDMIQVASKARYVHFQTFEDLLEALPGHSILFC